MDAGILAANRAPIQTSADVDEIVVRYISAQLPENTRLANLDVASVLSPDGRTISVTATAEVRNYFGAFTRRPVSPVTVRAASVRGMNNAVELVMVLDTTGSMGQNNKMSTLKNAAVALIDILTSDSKNNVSIGLVPFAQYVNVGTSNRGASWLTDTNDYTTTTNVAASCTTRRDLISQVCVPVTTVSYNDGVASYGTGNQCTNQVYGPPYDVCTPASSYTTKYKWNGCVGSRPRPSNLDDGDPDVRYPALFNINCGTALVPLSTKFGALKGTINSLSPSGETYGPAGLIWGLNVLSASAPFTEGAAYDPNRTKPRKALVFMTDGVNTKSMPSAVATNHNGTSRSDADSATATLCTNIKAKGIEIFAVALMVDDAAAKALLQNCASDPAHYFDATNTSALTSAFKQIGLSLQSPYLAK